MTNATIHDMLDAGASVAEIASAEGVTAGAVYARLRKLGRSAQQVRADKSSPARATSQCRSYEGYRVCTSDGRVQSCWSSGCSPTKTGHWRDLTISVHRAGTSAAALFVQLGSSGGKRRRLSLRTIYADAIGSSLHPRKEKMDAMYAAMCNKMGIK